MVAKSSSRTTSAKTVKPQSKAAVVEEQLELELTPVEEVIASVPESSTKSTKTSKVSKTVKNSSSTTPVQSKPAASEAEPAVAKKTTSTKSAKTTKSAPAPVPEVSAPEPTPAKAPAKRGVKAAAVVEAPAPKTAPKAKRSKKAAAPVEEVEVDDEPVDEKPKKGESSASKSRRTFKLAKSSLGPEVDLTNLSKNGGRYLGTPMQGAKKCFGQIAKKVFNGQECELTFTIQECTQGSDKDQYTYSGVRTRLQTPRIIIRQGAEYPVNYENVVKSVGKKAK